MQTFNIEGQAVWDAWDKGLKKALKGEAFFLT